ncbi:MAG: pilus assembly protein [Anaerolineae bacterium]|nr:pilus assembly protein [Anaerolineae bacterium]
MLWRSRRKSGQEGQALVETTFMLLAVLLLLMGIIEFGFLFYTYVRVSNATREGARAGSLWLMHGEFDLCKTVSDAVRSEVGAIQEDDITITLESDIVSCPYVSLRKVGEPITVTATYNYPLPIVSALPIIGDIIPSPFPVSRTAVMRFQ